MNNGIILNGSCMQSRPNEIRLHAARSNKEPPSNRYSGGPKPSIKSAMSRRGRSGGLARASLMVTVADYSGNGADCKSVSQLRMGFGGRGSDRICHNQSLAIISIGVITSNPVTREKCFSLAVKIGIACSRQNERIGV